MLLPAWSILSLRCGPQGRGPRHLLKPEPQHIPSRTPRCSQVSSSLCTRSLGPLAAPLTTPHPRGSRMHLLGDTFRLQNLGSVSHLVLYMLSPYWCQESQGKREAASPSLPFLLQLFPPGPPVCYHCDKGHNPKQLREERLISLLTGQAVVKEDQAGAQGRN